MRPPPTIATARLGVFTIGEAKESGWSDRELSYAVKAGRLRRVRRGVFAIPPDALRPGERLAQDGLACALAIDGAVLSHAAAAAVHRLPLLDAGSVPCITLPPPYLTNRLGLHAHRHRLPPDQITAVGEVAVTSISRTCIDVTRELGLASGLVAADAAVHKGLCLPSDLNRVYDQSCRGRAGLADGRLLLEMVDAKAESPLESISRLAMRGLPQPRTQVPIFSESGTFIGRVDFYWDEFGVVGEADGRDKYTNDELWREKIRQDKLTDHGVVVERWTWAIARRPGALPAQLDNAFRRAERLRAAGIRPRVRVL